MLRRDAQIYLNPLPPRTRIGVTRLQRSLAVHFLDSYGISLDTVIPDKSDEQPTNADGSDLQQREPTPVPDDPCAANTDASFAVLMEAIDALDVIEATTALRDRYDLAGAPRDEDVGEFFSAHDRRLDRAVAIKRFAAETVHNATELTHIVRTVRSIAAIQHKTIARILDYGFDRGGAFLVTEPIEGETLDETLRERTLDWETAVAIVCQICEALSRLHAQGIVHRNLQPAHVVHTAQGEVKLIDFGVRGSLGEQPPSQASMSSSERCDYRAPEQRSAVTVDDPRADLWSLAAILFQMVTGDAGEHVDLDRVEEPLRTVLAKGLSQDPGDRYQTASELRTDLLEIYAVHHRDRSAALGAPLAKGACRQCAEINNVDRAFCGACGAKLKEPCLACDADNEVWTHYCGQCGSKLDELVAHRQDELEQEKRAIESLRREYAYAEALARIAKMECLDHPRLATTRQWTEQMERSIETEVTEQQTGDALLLEAAKSDLERYRYAAACTLLDQIPHSIRSPQASALASEASGRREELEHLLEEIKKRVSTRDLAGLWRQTERFLTLYPGHSQISRLDESLQTQKLTHIARIAECVQQAEIALAAGEHEQTLAKLAELAESDQQDSTVKELRRQTKIQMHQVEKLRDSIADADYATEMLALVDEYLELQPQDQSALELHEELAAEVDLEERELVSRKRQWRGVLALAVLMVIVAVTLTTWIWTNRQIVRPVAAERDPSPTDVDRPLWGVSENRSGPTATAQETRVAEAGANQRSAPNDQDTPAPVSPPRSTAQGTGRSEPATVKATDDVTGASPISSGSDQPKAESEPTRKSERVPVLVPFSAQQAVRYQQAWAEVLKVPVGLTNSIGLELKLIPAGEFLMGSSDGVADRDLDESQHVVKLSQPYYLGIFEVTQQQYETVMGENHSKFRAPDRPVEQVSWDHAVEFCEELSRLPEEKAAGNVYRLPTEAEWEYACRAGTDTAYNSGESESDLSEVAWFNGNTTTTQPVGQKKPNAFGLYDMSGNVWEWCKDRYGPYDNEPVSDPQGADSGLERVSRGGSWINLPQVCRSARRSRYAPQRHYTVLGFRVLCWTASE